MHVVCILFSWAVCDSSSKTEYNMYIFVSTFMINKWRGYFTPQYQTELQTADQALKNNCVWLILSESQKWATKYGVYVSQKLQKTSDSLCISLSISIHPNITINITHATEWLLQFIVLELLDFLGKEWSIAVAALESLLYPQSPYPSGLSQRDFQVHH